MTLKEFLSDPTLQKDENGNILCRKIKNSKLHHMKPQFCMSPRLHSEGWEIVRKLEPPATVTQYNIPTTSTIRGIDNNGITRESAVTFADKYADDSETKEKVFSDLSKKGMTDISQSTDAPKQKRKTKRKTTTKRKHTVKTLTPETNNG